MRPLMLVLVVRRRAQSVASRSVIHPTRLETRTKESNMCASHSVLIRLERRNESDCIRALRSSFATAAGRSNSPPIPLIDGLAEL